MKFNLVLDESLFDDDVNDLTSITQDDLLNTDDTLFDFEDEHSIEDVLPGPATGPDTGVASELIALINDEWEAIQGYNNAIASLREFSANNSFYQDAIKVLEEISAEENRHVGQLQEVLKHISPNAEEIVEGQAEAKTQLGFVGGVLPVQSWNATPNNTVDKNLSIDTENVCTLSDVDDEM